MGQVSEIATKRPKIVCELRVSKHKAVHKNFNQFAFTLLGSKTNFSPNTCSQWFYR